MRELFRKFSSIAARTVGSPISFLLSVIIIIAWALTGPSYHYNDTWQLVINTGTTIITFLMVFLIQNTQNRDAKALHLKLDELIKATHGARNDMLDLDKLSDEQLQTLEEEYKRICETPDCGGANVRKEVKQVETKVHERLVQRGQARS